MKLFLKKKQPINSRRTSSGSRTAKVTSYYSPSSRGDSIAEIDMSVRHGKSKTKRPAVGRKVGLLRTVKRLVVVTLVVFLLFSLLYLRPDPIIVLDGNSTTERTRTYEPAITTMVQKSILNRSKLTIRSTNLEKQVLAEFPELHKVVFSTTAVGKRPIVHLYLQPILFSIESMGKTYVIAENGIVAGDSADFTGLESTITLRDESGVEVKKGSRILRSDDAEFFVSVKEVLQGQGRGLEGVRITQVPREAYLKVTGLSYELRVFLDDPADLQMGTFFSAEQALKGRGEAPTLYMDLRAGEKVYWQ